jgi:cell division protein FtsZ
MPQVVTHVEQPRQPEARMPELRPAAPVSPTVQRSSLFEDRPAPQVIVNTPRPSYEPQPEAKGEEPPSPEEDIVPTAFETEAPPAPPVAEAPRPEPTITRPGTYRPQPQAQPQSAPTQSARPQPAQPQPAPIPRATEEEGRESFWRGLFPQRQRSEAAFTPIGQIQTPPTSPEVDDGSDRYMPGASRTALNPAVRPDASPSSEAEDDLEIPSFLRRLAN